MDPRPPRILVGTASWTDPTLIKSGKFYPKGCTSSEARLRHYASRFPIVEVNSSYYALPEPATSQLWAERTPNDFTFNVKAFRLFTGHQTPLEALPPPVREALGPYDRKNVYYKDMPAPLVDRMWALFLDSLLPLRAAGKLGAVHFQFAPWMMVGPPSRAHIEECRARLPDDLLSVEFRHQSWFNERHAAKTLEFERRLGLVNVVVDSPQGFVNSIGAHWAVTQPKLALVRLHGRNAATWNIKSNAASDRFNYDYSEAELTEIAHRIAALAQEADAVHAIFNNNYEDQGQRNAATLRRILDDMLPRG